MDKAILDVEGAAALLGVSKATVYALAQKRAIPATKVGREWRFGRQPLIAWVESGGHAEQLQALLSKARPRKR
jgi:excisionase family DNA binding protein